MRDALIMRRAMAKRNAASARVSWRRPITLKHSREGVLQIKAVQLLGGEHQKLREKNW